MTFTDAFDIVLLTWTLTFMGYYNSIVLIKHYSKGVDKDCYVP